MVRPGLTYMAIAMPRRRRGYIDLLRLQAWQRRALTELPCYPTAQTSTAPKGADQRRSLAKLRGYSAVRTKEHLTVRLASDQDTCGPYIAQVGTHSSRTLTLTTWRSYHHNGTAAIFISAPGAATPRLDKLPGKGATTVRQRRNP